jgi:hypothetical protein
MMSVESSTISLFAGMAGLGTIVPQLVTVEIPSQPSMSEFGDGDADYDMDEDGEKDEEMTRPSRSLT